MSSTIQRLFAVFGGFAIFIGSVIGPFTHSGTQLLLPTLILATAATFALIRPR